METIKVGASFSKNDKNMGATLAGRLGSGTAAVAGTLSERKMTANDLGNGWLRNGVGRERSIN